MTMSRYAWVEERLEILRHKFGQDNITNNHGMRLSWNVIEYLLYNLYDHLYARATYLYFLDVSEYDFDPRDLLVYF